MWIFKTQDGGQPPLWKPLNRNYLRNRLTDFDEIWHGDVDWPPTGDRPLKFRIFQKPRWRRPPSWFFTIFHKNRDISSTVWPIFTKFCTIMQNGSLNRPAVIKFELPKIQDGGLPPFWKKTLNRHVAECSYNTVWDRWKNASICQEPSPWSINCLLVSIQYRVVTDGQTDRRRQRMRRQHSVARQKRLSLSFGK